MKRYWPVAVVVLVGAAFCANMLLLYLATSDPSFGVEPDYYAKALAWDEQRAQLARNARLGWNLDLQIHPAGPDGAQRVEVLLADAADTPIADAAVRLTAFHNARSVDLAEVELQPRGDGRYEGDLRFHRPGLWEFRFEARRGDAVFTETRLQDVWNRPHQQARGKP